MDAREEMTRLVRGVLSREGATANGHLGLDRVAQAIVAELSDTSSGWMTDNGQVMSVLSAEFRDESHGYETWSVQVRQED